MINDCDSSISPAPAEDEPAATIPTSVIDSSLLSDLAQVWGSSVAIDELSAKAIILTVLGGVAGNSVRIDVPRVGELGADIQLAVNKDSAPALRRGMQRLLHSFELSILATLKQYEHLSSKRAQRQEAALVETEFNLLKAEHENLMKIIKDDRQMMGLALQKQEAQTLRRWDEIAKTLGTLRTRMSAIYFRMRPMVMAQELGSDIDQVAEHSFDNALLEVVASPGYLDRLAMLREKHLERLAAFRRNSGWASRLEFCDGDYRRRASISTVLLASGDELRRGWSDRLLRSTGLLDEVLVCVPCSSAEVGEGIPDPGDRWSAVVQRLFGERIAGMITTFKLDTEAKDGFEEVRKEFLKQGSKGVAHAAELWAENGPALVARLALCARLLRGAEGPLVGREDLEAAIPVARHLLESTAAHLKRAGAKPVKVGRREKIEKPKIPQSPLARMVAKLRRLGPCSMRTLSRNYPKMKYSDLQPILDRAVEVGLVEVDGKLIKAVDYALLPVGMV